MNIRITSFSNPFSFFCTTCESEKSAGGGGKLTSISDRNFSVNKTEIAKLVHGQYVAVYWKNMWHRGIVNMEAQFLIWLIDYGIHIRFNDKIVCVDLESEFKKIPTKIFEASLHGVMPVVTTVSSNYNELENKMCTTWNQAAIKYSQQLIDSASIITFVPVALLNTHHNEIVLGDLYLKIPGRNLINLAEELQNVPTFLQINDKIYLENLPQIYVNRRRHRACTLKPNIPSEIPTITLSCMLEEYSAICAKVPKLQPEPEPEVACTSDGSTVLGEATKKVYKLTSEEIEEYANMYVDICGTEYNLLNLLLNKIEDLNMCEKYKKYEGKGVGRGFNRHNCDFNW